MAARLMCPLILLLALMMAQIPALAVQPDEVLANPQLEARAREISRNLRCLVCQNQSIDDSNAPLARDLRVLVRERLQAGDDDQAAVAYLTARYGDYVLLLPPFQGNTLLLWLGPLAVLLAGLTGVLVWFRRLRRAAVQPAPPAEAPLSPEETRRLTHLLTPDP